MSEVLPIVSMSGPPELHQRAGRYALRLEVLHRLEDELWQIENWNDYERFESGGLFSSVRTRPPKSSAHVVDRINQLRQELIAERAEISKLSEGTLRP